MNTQFISENLKQIDGLEQVNITTNGIMLTRLLAPMQRAGLNGINISLDTLSNVKYETITRRKGFDRVIAGIDLAIQLGYKPKVNCVVMKKFNDSELCDFVEFTKDRNVDVRFIEYMPFNGNKWDTVKMVTYRWAVWKLTNANIYVVIFALFLFVLPSQRDAVNDSRKLFRFPCSAKWPKWHIKSIQGEWV